MATLVLTVWLYIVAPKGFFPVQDTRVIQGISTLAKISFPAMAEKQEALKSHSGDPAVIVSHLHRGRWHQHDIEQGRVLIN
jgi:multidrug efflux pump